MSDYRVVNTFHCLRGKIATKKPIHFRDSPFHEKQTVWAWLPVHLCKNVLKLPSWEQSVTLLDTHLPFPCESRWAYELTYSTLTRVAISHKISETFSPNLTVQNNKYCKWQTKRRSSSSELREDSPREMKGEKDMNENTKVVQCRYLHLTQGLKTEVYLHTGGRGKLGQATPTKQHKKTNEKEQEKSMSIRESWKKGLRGPQ